MAKKKRSGKYWVVIYAGYVRNANKLSSEELPAALLACPVCRQTKVNFYQSESEGAIDNEERCAVCKHYSWVVVDAGLFETDSAD